MEYDTAGKEILKPKPNCHCGLTGGCYNCMSWHLKTYQGLIDECELPSEEEKKFYDENLKSSFIK